MKSIIATAVMAIAFSTVPLAAAEIPKECLRCAGVSVPGSMPSPTALSTALPLLITVDATAHDSAATMLASLGAEQKKHSVLLLSFTGVPSTVEEVDREVAPLLELARSNGPFRDLAVELPSMNSELTAYAAKRLAVSAEGHGAADQLALVLHSVKELDDLSASGALSYVDAWLVRDPAMVKPAAEWLAAHDPGKKVIAELPVTGSPNALYEPARAFADGADAAFTLRADAAPALVTFNREFAGDFTFDATSGSQLLDAHGTKIDALPLSFVRGEDLRTIVVTPGDSAQSTIVSISADDGTNPRRIDANGASKITDSGKKNRRLLIGIAPSAAPFALSFDRPAIADPNVARETVNVATKRGLSVEEIVRKHQAYHDFQKSIEPKYIAYNATRLRFNVGAGEQVEATLAGDHFFDPAGHNDWIWKDLYINGVRWKYGKIPELPLIQPEKVSQLPLDIHLTNDYRYSLVGETKVGSRNAYEVRFEPPREAVAALPLYRGTVFIDQRTFARLRLSMIQLNLSGEVLSNEERVDFVPFNPSTGVRLSDDMERNTSPRDLMWLPETIAAQQVLSTAGRTTAVNRATTFTNYRINPPDYETSLADASKSEARMVRDTGAGLRYLERKPDGTRVVKEGFDSSKLFMLGGLHHDAGLQFPVVPLGGIDYFNFNVANKGLQANVFFAGIVIAANLTNPSFHHTRFNVGADSFGLAIPVENSIYRNGQESPGEKVKTLPALIAGRVGHPVLGFGKLDFSVGVGHVVYQRAEETAHDFVVPSDTFEVIPGVDFRYERRGYTLGLGAEYGTRTSWKPWGNLNEYDPAQKNFERWKFAFGKSFYLPKFQRVSMEVDYLDGRNLDRFSKYELGFFGSNRVRGVQSGSVRAERSTLGHLSYGFVISDQLRLEAFYDHALIDDAASGYKHEPFQGVGIAGQTIGPFGTLMRIDLGKSIGRNAQSDFVADVVFLKIFR